jgi:hypothetical protein
MHDDLQDQIASLEAEIELLSERAQRCRKIIVLGKVSTVAGGLLFSALLVGLFRSNAVLLVASITALLGGVALSGTSQGTLDVLRASIGERETLRTEIIDRLELHTIETG